ncbi:MAG: nucleoside triphosphate pyrophosphohydrolase, partial [Peptostreptococcales bacterium]
ESLVEELGDLLLQVVFHANIAEEDKQFTMKDILQRVTDKMLYRHPHVFGDIRVKGLDEALITWEEMKHKEKQHKTIAENMQSIPKELPALMRSMKVQKKAAEVGFDWQNISYAIDKLQEEIAEFLEACASRDREAREDEMGDILFSVVNVARFANIQPEEALNKSIEKFIFRFNGMESKASEKGAILQEMSLDEMDKLWDEIKKS